jgi:hypothetical protein
MRVFPTYASCRKAHTCKPLAAILSHQSNGGIMKPLKFLLLLVGIGALAMKLSSCQSSPSEAQTFSLTVRVLYPSNYAQTAASGATVRVRNIESGTRDSAVTNAAGEARFSRLLPGTYEISASRRLSTSEAQTLTGFAVEQNLNAVLTGFVLRSAADSVVTLRLAGSPVGNLVIKECYWTGSTTRSGGTYFSDQFHEIYNNSTDTIFVDSLCIADVYGPAGQINPGTRPTEFQNDPNNVYVNSIWMIPGTGRQRPLAPGQSIIIAQDGINHRADTAFAGVENRTVDLSRADWETFNERPDNRDADSPTVPNLVRVYFTGGFDWLVPVFGPGIVIFKAYPNMLADSVRVPGSSPAFAPRIRIANSRIIDAFEALQNPQSGNFKRIPAALDAGFVSTSDTYSSKSARRKLARRVGTRVILQDTNNSGNDFDIITPPTPRQLPQ